MAEQEKHEEASEGGHGGGGHSGGGGHGGGGGHEEAHEGAPEWLISFADNVALMMGFFVILLAMNMAKKTVGGGGARGSATADDLDFVLAIRKAFNPINMDSDNPAEAPLRKRIREKAERDNRSLQPEDPGKGKIDQAIRPTDLSTLGGTIEFDDESTSLSAKGQQRAQEIAGRLKGLRFIIELRGHASPSETYRNDEKGIGLSYSRALAVARCLVAQGIRWDQLRIMACGDNEQKSGRNYDRDADRQNQRVNIVPTNDPVVDNLQSPTPQDKAKDEPKGQAAAPTGQE